ncbi:hypothetical protein D3C77_442600 [compost metagenome]
MRTRLATREDGRSLRFDDNDAYAREMFLQILACSCNRAACPRGGDEHIEAAVHLLNNFWACRQTVNARVGFILKLLRHEAVRDFCKQQLRLLDSARHPFGRRSQHNLCAVSFQYIDSFLGHIVRHDENGPIAFGRSRHGQSNPCISARWLDNCRSKL